MLAKGGSALDAAIAVQLVLGLVEPESSGIGGGAFLLHWSEKARALRSYDGRETAPAAAHRDRFMKDGKPMPFPEAMVGGRSVGVPGVMAMLELAHGKHGRLAWRELFEPAIRLAEGGFEVSHRLQAVLERERFLREDPEARAIYYARTGTRIVNKAYAETLRRIAHEGAGAMYRGEIAADIVRAVSARGGDLSAQDLAAYKSVEREPVCAPYRRYRVCSMGPPSAGGVAVLQILGLLERKAFDKAPARSAAAVHLFAEAGRLAYADRARYGADPDFVPVPVKALLAPAYLEKRAALIGERAMRLAPPGDTEANGTSHLSIADAEGNVVAMTTTIEASFGSRVMARGFHLNNELTDFDFVPGGANEVAPGKRPRSSMAPVIVFDAEGRVRMALGSPGGPWIINFVAKTLVAALDWRLDAQAAIDVPNFGNRNGPTVLEEGTPPALVAALKSRGHETRLAPLASGVHLIERVPGGWRGGADQRREGVAGGR
ncbi:MAG: gamma-glutamyltranspeptidase / glutathione hydrolase [Betaproteobacteria bacterium]|jgi:gamma-glutamyltranspeptidase/glutathione hydrolase|nr:gamma-glutamyltranspeptidase / glutathione hydrolase [Betaproteobacteria bacterium]